MPSLYRRILGPAFDALPVSLQDFHDVVSTWQGHATFRVRHGPGRLRHLLAVAGGLPPEGEFALKLTLVAEDKCERWIREFGGFRMESVQWMGDGLLLEQFGSLRFGFRLLVEPPALRLQHVRTWIRGVPWPRALGPQGWAEEVGREDGCAVVARALAPVLGLIVQYEGLLKKGAGVSPGK